MAQIPGLPIFFSSYLNYQALQSETSRLDKPRLCWGPLEWTTFPKCQKFHQNPPWLCRKSMAALSLKTERGILQLVCFQGSQRLSEMPWEVLFAEMSVFAGNCRQVAQWEEVLRSAGWKEARETWYCQRRGRVGTLDILNDLGSWLQIQLGFDLINLNFVGTSEPLIAS